MAQLTDILESNTVCKDTPTPDPVVPPIPDVILETTTPPFSALSIASDLPATPSSTIVNDDLYFEAYLVFLHEFALVFPVLTSLEDASPSLPLAFQASALPYNSILNSRCTHHILFWDYDTTQTIPVKTANCGFLSTLACGTVRFRVTSGNCSVVFVLKDCLHAPDAPINLLSVGALTEKGAIFTFSAN